MKKYILGVLFFLGCFFLSLTHDTNLISADSTAFVSEDPYDSRIITIEFTGLHPSADLLKLNEVERCNQGEENCNAYLVNGNDTYLRILDTKEYNIVVDTNVFTATITHNITSQSDGTKLFYAQPYRSSDNYSFSAYVCLFEHRLSTLTQRVVVNPDGEGNPLYIYDHIQYSPVRTISITIDLLNDELSSYSGVVYVCEVLNGELSSCGDYIINNAGIDYYIPSYGDGEKAINIYLLNFGYTSVDTTNMKNEFTNKATLISKNIYLDTIGPEIVLEGGNWVYLEANEQYSVQKATCSDAVFSLDQCDVTNDLDIVTIDYTSDKYQIVTYESSDRLGNISSVAVKIRVEMPKENSNLGLYLIISGGVLIVTGLILGWVLIKNHEKKKKLSYI